MDSIFSKAVRIIEAAITESGTGGEEASRDRDAIRIASFTEKVIEGCRSEAG